jgi:hypothetical protein
LGGLWIPGIIDRPVDTVVSNQEDGINKIVDDSHNGKNKMMTSHGIYLRELFFLKLGNWS